MGNTEDTPLGEQIIEGLEHFKQMLTDAELIEACAKVLHAAGEKVPLRFKPLHDANDTLKVYRAWAPEAYMTESDEALAYIVAEDYRRACEVMVSVDG